MTKASALCQWCGAELAEQEGRGRRRKYCSDSCKQRAYEHRNNVAVTPAARRETSMTQARASKLHDRLFQLRCAAEDIATAVDENADSREIEALCTELVTMAKEIERAY